MTKDKTEGLMWQQDKFLVADVATDIATDKPHIVDVVEDKLWVANMAVD